MKHFEHENAKSFEQASERIKEGGGKVQAMAGGTDLLGVYKDCILDDYPETVLNLKSIEGENGVTETDGGFVIGALSKLKGLAENDALKSGCPALAEAAYSVASPLIRSLATIGGNVCQDVRCWYYRYPDSIGGKLDCKRKGGGTCYAINGENRYHSVYGGMRTGGTSCSQHCPAGTDIPAYMAFLRAGNWKAAADTIMLYNPMPMLTSRICPHPCQDECSQCTYGESVNIHGVERALGEYILEHKSEYYAPPASETGKRTVVIGAGPGGLAAAYYLRRAGHSVAVYDRMEQPGGVLRYGIPHYRLPKTLVDEFTGALADMGVEFHMGVDVGKDVSVEELRAGCDALYLGTGAWKQPILGLEGESLTEFGLDFLVEVNTYLKKATGSSVLVCGQGNVAIDVALTTKRLGAKTVNMVVRRQRNGMTASEEEIETAEEEGVNIYNGWGLKRIVKDENGKVRGLEAKRCNYVKGENGRLVPVYDEDDTMIIEADCIILATGQQVDIDYLGEPFVSQLKSRRGLIEADIDTLKTSIDGVYAGGDAVTGPNIAIRAIRAGRVAAMNMSRDLGGAAAAPAKKEKFIHFDREKIEPVEANKLPMRAPEERTLFEEDISSMSREAVLDEAGRCMNCGCYAVNPSDITPVLVMLGADIVTTERTISAKELFTDKLTVQQVLHQGELVKEIRVPKLDGVMHYDKKRVRNAIDFAIVSLASWFVVEDGVIKLSRVVFGGVAPVPYEMPDVDAFLTGKRITPELAKEAAELAVSTAQPMSKNEYKLFMVKDLLSQAILRAGK